MIFSLFKLFKIVAWYVSFVVFLFHQTSDKKLLRMNGKGIEFLTELKTGSSGSSDLHSERVEVESESLLSKFINQTLTVKGSFKS